MNFAKIMIFVLATGVYAWADVINPDIKPVQKNAPAQWYTDAAGALAGAIAAGDVDLVERALKVMELAGEKRPLLPCLQATKKLINNKRAAVKRWTVLWSTLALGASVPALQGDLDVIPGMYPPHFPGGGNGWTELVGRGGNEPVLETHWFSCAFWHLLPVGAALFVYRRYKQNMGKIDTLARALVGKLKASQALEAGAD